MRTRAYGEQGVLCELDPHEVPGWHRAIAALPAVSDAIAGAQTVLALPRPGVSIDQLTHQLAELHPAAIEAGDLAEIVLTVDYDGPDLHELAELTGLSPDEIVELHAAGSYRVRFCGFAPGFAYLDGLAERLHVPRRAEPRTTVPAGAVAIAGPFAGVYPTASPGGWRLLGHTDARLWDVERNPPALLVPGTPVRFEPR